MRISFDNTKYTNRFLGDQFATDAMIEIKSLGNPKDRIVLNGINARLQERLPGLQTSKQSKYERGIEKIRPLMQDRIRENQSNSTRNS